MFKLLFELMLQIIGFVLVGLFAGWLPALGLFFWTWGNNLMCKR